MKKIMIILLATVALSMPSQAQVKFGLKGGLNLTNMTFSESGAKDAVKNKAGFFVGPTVKFTLPVVGLSLDASALYDQRSAKASYNKEDGTVEENTIKTQSIQIPVNVRYGVGLGSIVNLFAFAGPQFGFNIGDKHQTILKDAAEWTLRSSNISANIGIGATVLDHLQVTFNYNIPLGKTGEIEPIGAAKEAWKSTNGRANAWQISAGYFF